MCLTTARAIDAQPVGVVFVNYRDLEALKADCARDRQSGFMGKIAIHPAQTEIINAAFTPTVEEEDRAPLVKEIVGNLHKLVDLEALWHNGILFLHGL